MIDHDRWADDGGPVPVTDTVTDNASEVFDDVSEHLERVRQAMNLTGPEPHVFTYEEAYALQSRLYRLGTRFFFRGAESDDESMQYDTLAHCVRAHDEFDTEGCSDPKLWSGVIVPAIVAGRIEYAVWGVVQNLQNES